MGKTIRRFNRSEVPKNVPYKKSGKEDFGKYKGMSSYDFEEEDEFEWFDEFREED